MTDCGLYVHIPFCEKRCKYCSFFSSVSGRDIVSAYVDELVSTYEKNIAELREETEQLKRQNQTLMSENAESFKKLTALEGERDFVSKAVISAEQRAQEVMEETKKEMATLKANKAAEIALAEEELKKLRAQIAELKQSAVATLRKYEAQMDDLVVEK